MVWMAKPRRSRPGSREPRSSKGRWEKTTASRELAGIGIEYATGGGL
jgi:hypothetical protein